MRSLEQMPGQCLSMMLEQMPEQCHVRNVRTYVRTTHLWSFVSRKSARAGGRPIFPQMVNVSACASRGQDAEVCHA